MDKSMEDDIEDLIKWVDVSNTYYWAAELSKAKINGQEISILSSKVRIDSVNPWITVPMHEYT